MFEHRSQPLLPPRAFLRRLLASAAAAAALVAVSLAIGMVGYHGFENLGWLDAYLNSAMLLGGMGPVNTPVTAAGKLFAGVYALYCGFVVLFTAGIVLAPIAHRLMHWFHLADDR